MTRKFLFAALGAASLGLAPLTAVAEDKTGENVTMDQDAASDSAVAKAALAQELFSHARDSKSAVAALAAAQIMMSLDLKDVEREKETRDTEGAPANLTEEDDTSEAPADGAAMLAAAREFAAGDSAMMGLIEDVEAEGSRGRIGGASRTLSRLRAGRTDVFRVPYYGGRLAELAILGDGDADLDLLVTDENGNAICIDRSYSDKLYCAWTPRWDGYFLIAVVNQGRKRNSYYMLTN